jgi:hypothetical protein
MDTTYKTADTSDNQLSLKDLILSFQKWLKYLLAKWKIIILFGMIGGGIGFVYAYFKTPQYVAQLNFVLEDSKSGSLGGYAGLASQFGIDLGGSGTSGVFAGDNIIEFLRSRLMVEKTLLSPVVLDGKQTSLAEFYLDINNVKTGWKYKPALSQLTLPADMGRKKFSVVQDSVLFTIYQSIVVNNLRIAKPDRKLSFILVQCMSKNELFSKYFIERLVKEATDFYVQTKTKRSKINVDKLQEKADSIEKLLNQKTYSAAVAQDYNLNPVKSVARVNTEMVTRDKMVLQTMYAEVVKNLELSRLSMAQETPIIQIVDTPILPLKKEQLGKIKSLIIGAFLGGFLILIWLVLRKTYRDVMSS